MPTLAEIAARMDALLRTSEIPDYPQALNGIQVDTDAPINRVAAAVDVREQTIRGAVEAGANLLIVHHGLFWGGLQPIRGVFRRRVEGLLSNNIGLYSSHLPLDAHERLGNNVLLAQELGLRPSAGFARHETVDVGLRGEASIPTTELVTRAAAFSERWGGTVRHSTIAAGRVTKRWALCTGAGAAADTLQEAVALGVDTLIVGEGPHWTAVDGDDLGIAIVYAGHYATETPGVRALAEHVSHEFGVPWSFLHIPTGL